MDERDQITRALDIESRRLAERAESLRREAGPSIEGALSDFARRGLGASGMAAAALIEIETERIRRTVRAAGEIRREISKTVPALGSEKQINDLRERLYQRIDAEWGALPGLLGSRIGMQYVQPLLSSAQYDTTPLTLKSEVARDLANIRDEVALGMHKPASSAPNITVNISGTVGGVNFGAIAGDMNTAINIVQETGGEKLAQALKELTEAIDREKALSAEARAEAIQHLATITEEAAKPPDRRKWISVQVLCERIGSIVKSVAQLKETWDMIYPQISGWFHGKPPGV